MAAELKRSGHVKKLYSPIPFSWEVLMALLKLSVSIVYRHDIHHNVGRYQVVLDEESALSRGPPWL